MPWFSTDYTYLIQIIHENTTEALLLILWYFSDLFLKNHSQHFWEPTWSYAKETRILAQSGAKAPAPVRLRGTHWVHSERQAHSPSKAQATSSHKRNPSTFLILQADSESSVIKKQGLTD